MEKEEFPERILTCLSRYRNEQTSEDAKILLDFYTPFIYKWVGFLRTSFISNETQFTKFLKFFKIPGDLHSKHEVIRRSLRLYENQDLAQEVQLAFLESCSKSAYPLYNFVYTLSLHIRKLISDPLVFGLYCEDDTNLENFIIENESNLIYFKGKSASVDPSWVQGLTVDSPILAGLNPRERELLLRRFVGEQNAKEIAQDMGYSSQKIVWNSLGRAIKKVKKNNESTS